MVGWSVEYISNQKPIVLEINTIEILPDSTTSQLLYRATCSGRHATGQTPGQALDILEFQLDLNGNLGETLVILQRFRADDLLNCEQKE